MLDYERDTKTLVLGDRITVQTFRGVKGNIIGRMSDGLVVIFNRDSPYISLLALDQSVDCSVNYVSERYVIVDPIREPKPIERLETTEIEEDRRFENLRRLSEEGEWEIGIIARALIHIIKLFDSLKVKPPKRSSQKTETVVEEPVEQPPASDEFLQAADSFGLTQTYVREQKAPKSELQRYVDEYQEEKRREAEAPSQSEPKSLARSQTSQRT